MTFATRTPAFALLSLLVACATQAGFQDDNDGGDPKSDGGASLSGDGGGSSADGSVSADGGPSASSKDGGTQGGGDGGSSGNDGSVVGPPPGTSCGGSPCYSGQACVSGACTYDGCTGAHIPGDYATVQGAVNALESLGGTLCLGPQAFQETVAVNVPNGKSLTLQGISSAKTSLLSLTVNTQGTFEVKGISTTSMSLGGGSAAGTATVTACKIQSTANGQAGITIGASSSYAITATLDGVDVSALGTAISLTSNSTDYASLPSLIVTVKNSYVHDSTVGLSYGSYSPYGYSLGTNVVIVNDTFVNDQTALLLTTQTLSGFGVTFVDNLFYKNPLAINVGSTITSGTTFANNALFGNTTNYAGLAIDGKAYVKSDPLLDTSTVPPHLGAGSPCLGAADTASATTADFWGNPRGSHPDIGAVQTSP